jgi:hypothetical protein
VVRAFDRVPQFLLAKRLHNGIYRFDEDGELEKRCSTCREYWPADSDFFYTHHAEPDGLHSLCRDCHLQSRDRSKAKARARLNPIKEQHHV